MSDSLTELRNALTDTQALPVLFVGSGISRRYLDTPDWDGLLDHFASLTKFSAGYYRGKANEDRPEMASAIAAQFYDEWFNNDDYTESRAAYEHNVRNVADPLKYEIARYISASTLPSADNDDLGEEFAAFGEIKANAIITTNWDTLIESAFPDLEVFVGQQDVLFATTQAIGEIYKIHGSATDPESIIVTAEDYAEYWDRNPYLIAKLLTMLVEHPVLFLGYSLGDRHINRMLENLISALNPEQVKVLNDRLIFVKRQSADAPSTLERGSLTVGDHTLNIRILACANFKDLFVMLSELPERFPAKLLRRLRESVYELTFSSEPTGRVHVLPIEGGPVDDIEVVVGVGVMERLGEKGYSSLDRSDAFHDMLSCETDHNPEQFLSALLPTLFRLAKFSPIYYPLYLAERLNPDGTVADSSSLPARALALLTGATKLSPYSVGQLPARKKQHFRDLLAEDEGLALNYGLACQYDLEDVMALRSFLVEKIPQQGPIETPLAKLGCKYDRLVFGPDFVGDRVQLHVALGVTSRASAFTPRLT